jgi:hypothetical protein
LIEIGREWKRCGVQKKNIKRMAEYCEPEVCISTENKKCRETYRPILNQDQTWVNANLMFRKSWRRTQVVGIATNVNASNRVTVAHLGGSDGFVEGCELATKRVKQQAITTGEWTLIALKNG